MKLVNRKQWGAVKTNPLPTNITPQFGGVAIHYMGGEGKATPSSHAKCAGIVQGIQRGHINDRGWIDVAYSFLVCVHGYVFEGRGLHKRTAANRSPIGNQNFYAVCGLVNDLDDLTPELIQGIKDACQYLRTKGSAGDQIIGHRNLVSTSCPGKKLYKEVQKGTFKRPKIAEDNSYPGSPLSIGSTGKNVRKVQARLKALGYQLEIDGDYEKITADRIRKFQKANRLKVDGITGENTWDILF